MKRIVVTVEQLARPAPGGIATYVRGLVSGLVALDADVIGLGPRRPAPTALGAPSLGVRVPVAVLSRLWSRWPLGVPGDAAVVHATTIAGPYAGGSRGAVHSVALHDLLWRDEPESSTRSGASYHESRLRALRGRGDVRVFTTSPLLDERLVAEGFERDRLRRVRLGVDEAVNAATKEDVAAALAGRGVVGPFTLFAGTREPRKNLAALATAHRAALAEAPALGPLVLVGPAGWGRVDAPGATDLGVVSRDVLLGLYRDASVVAYVPRAEGWGLPPVEALARGARVVASSATPSVADNPEAVVVDALDVSAIGEGLCHAVTLDDDDAARARRRDSVAGLTWHASALDHVAGWA
ncbi:MAG: hypothetical protein ACRDV0_07215 [Acidimicrobiales bacterium]